MLEFFTALTLVPSDIRKISELIEQYGVFPSPLQRILLTPLFIIKESLHRVRRLKEQQGAKVLFDSGGYYVQVGRLSYEELYFPLLQFYQKNPWGDLYTLPDHVPVSKDTEDDVWHKVHNTVRFSTLFFQELPSALKDRAMPVVQGHTFEQVDYCLKAYLNLGVSHIGFGSFGTLGQKSEVNVATNSAVDLARYVTDLAQANQISVHFFGLGVPALVAMIYGAGASSFDSSSWIKSAGFGQVYLPFMRAYNISHQNGRSELQKGITIQEFNELRTLTDHECPFCNSINNLQRRKLYRALHNLMVIQQTVNMINAKKHAKIKLIYEHGSPRYREEHKKWLATD